MNLSRFIPIFVYALLSCIGVLYAAEQGPAISTKYQLKKISPNAYVIHGPLEFPSAMNQGFMNNPGFVITKEGVVVIDPGSSVQIGRMVLEKIASVTSSPVVASIATHIHGDHWLGNHALVKAYPNIQLYGHPQLIELAEQGEAENWIRLMLQLTHNSTKGTIPKIPDRAVNNGDVLQIGDVDFEIHHTGSAHTNTDIAVFVRQEDLMFTGDLVFNKRFGRMDGGHFQGLNDFLAHLISLNPAVVVPGHGETAGIELIDQMMDLNQIIYQTVQEHYEEGLSDFEIKPIVIENLGEYTSWAGFDEGIGRVVSLCYIEVEENSF